VKALIIAPTRELAVQIDRQMEGLGLLRWHVSSIAIYGGKDGLSWEQEKTALSQGGADVIICTPGTANLTPWDSTTCGSTTWNALVMDEADRMLDMGFHDDIIKIVEATPSQRGRP
jgi:ATP-dependent RNA helicase RhlE